jgi:hypothetical protein
MFQPNTILKLKAKILKLECSINNTFTYSIANSKFKTLLVSQQQLSYWWYEMIVEIHAISTTTIPILFLVKCEELEPDDVVVDQELETNFVLEEIKL